MNGILLVAATAVAFLAGGSLAYWFWVELRSGGRVKFVEAVIAGTATKHSPPEGRITTPFTTSGRAQQATALLTCGCRCSETVLGAYGPSLGLSRGEAFEIGLRLARKVNMCETCGAVTGAFIILSKCQQTEVQDRGASEKRLASSLREFSTKFQARHGTITCRKFLIQSARNRKPRAIRDETMIPGLCPRLVRDAGELLEQMLDNGRHRVVAA